jgi:hypothetical protein
VRVAPRQKAQRILGAAGFTDHADVRVAAEDTREALTHRGVLVHHEYAYQAFSVLGIRASTVTP